MAANTSRKPANALGRGSVRTPPAARQAVRRSMIAERFVEGVGVMLLVAAAYLLLSLVTYTPTDPSLSYSGPGMAIANWGGRMGAYISDVLLTTFGLGAFVWVCWLCFHAYNALTHREEGPSFSLQIVTLPLMLLSLGVLLCVFDPLPNWPHSLPVADAAEAGAGIGGGGLMGKLMAQLVLPLLGKVGGVMLMGALLALSILWFTGWTLADVKATCIWLYKVGRVMCVQLSRWVARLRAAVPEQFDLPLSHPVPKRPRPTVVVREDEPVARPVRRDIAPQASLPLALEGEFTLPPLDLLNEPKAKKGGESPQALEQNARRIEAELRNFNVEGTVTNIRPGPVITIYELEPAAGVKTSQILNLQDDLARAMSALSIRITTIPGKNVLGIEVPNRERQFLGLKELLDTDEFEHDAGSLVVALGVDTTGQPAYTDIAKMPHSLIAGTTGSGKSVAINAFIMSLLYRLTPDQLRFVMIDPKMLELSIYNDIPHLLTPVITDPNKAAAALNWVVKEMENRYRLMSEIGVKNIIGFNEKFAAMQAEGKVPTKLVQVGFDLNTGQPRHEEQPLATKPLPYIVVVIDELADLMMVAGKAVEFSIARLTQMARASGIHLLVATQRPSVDVVTGLIKANIPTRISFSVASKIDSRTVLDSMGAEALLGKGDMLHLANGSNNLQRLHGAFVSEDECTKVVQYLKNQSQPNYVEDVFKAGAALVPGSKEAKAAAAAGTEGGEDGEGGEGLYEQAVDIITREGKASTSFLQRSLKIGYNRAADLIDKMESEGLISAPNHVGKREVLGR
ncbi:MAG: cell division protein FtsK [Pseudomonas fluorescens]|nr:MAG: cell division protein FtsK [Pseudomonas fluorescens]